jgi:hypothetical protein
MGLQFSTGADRVDASFSDVLAVAPSDTISPATRLRGVRGIWSDAGGTVSVITEAVASRGEATGSAVTAAQAVSLTLTAGQALPLQVAYVLAAGTAATGLKAFY